MENGMIKDLVLFAIIIIIAAVVASFIFAPSDDGQDISNIEILNKGDFGDNSTLYIKLATVEGQALSGKTLHVQISDGNGSAVYTQDVETHATGVAMAKLDNVSAGEYTLNVTFDGDENSTASSISQEITVKGESVEDVVENSTLIEETISDDSYDDDYSQDTSSYSSQSTNTYTPSYSQSSSSSYSSSSSSSDSGYTYYDENGNEALPEYDEDGNAID